MKIIFKSSFLLFFSVYLTKLKNIVQFSPITFMLIIISWKSFPLKTKCFSLINDSVYPWQYFHLASPRTPHSSFASPPNFSSPFSFFFENLVLAFASSLPCNPRPFLCQRRSLLFPLFSGASHMVKWQWKLIKQGIHNERRELKLADKYTEETEFH